jgi:hypothetical protein
MPTTADDSTPNDIDITLSLTSGESMGREKSRGTRDPTFCAQVSYYDPKPKESLPSVRQMRSRAATALVCGWSRCRPR